jgi:D-3-phosphoglycerate dehydrogenase
MGNTDIVIIQPLGVDNELVETRANTIVPGHQIIWHRPETAGELDLSDVLGEVPYLITVNRPLTAESIANTQLKLISVSFTGYNHIDLGACRKRGIAVCNVPGYSTASVAELAVGLIISLLRNTAANHSLVKDQKWGQAGPGTELSGKTVGLVGTGAIGLATARLVAAFDCRLLGYSRSRNHDFEKLGGRYVPLEELLKSSDIVSLHLPLSKDTTNILSKEKLTLLKPSAYLVNTARGGMVDESYLSQMLKGGRLAGAGLDVFEQEPLPADSPLLEAPNLLLSPHVGYRTRDALLRKVDITLQNIADFEKGLKTNRVDL